MPQSLAKLLVHRVFSTKDRAPLIDVETRATLHADLMGILTHLHCPSLHTGGTAAHVHSLVSLPRTRSVAEVVEEVKKSSSRWMKQQGHASFTWQAGYGAFSVSESHD
jgi:putative transposase